MKRKEIYIALFIISVLGLFVVQYQYLRIGLNLAQVQFERKLERVAQNLRKDLSEENQLSFLILQSYNGTNYFSLSRDSLQDASRHFLNDLIEDRLAHQNIKTAYSFSLTSEDESISLSSPTKLDSEAEALVYPVDLIGYLPESLGKELKLHLKFNNLNRYFLSQLNGLLIPGLLFLAIIIFVLIWVFRHFYLQRNIISVTHDFINNLTHELKTPVFSIGVATKILETEVNREKRTVVAGHIRKQLERLNRHIDQVMELAGLESKKNIMQFESIDLQPAILECCKNFEMQAKLEGFKFSYDLTPGPYDGRFALSHIENSVNNLLDNARKYADFPEIKLSTHIKNRHLYVEIQDNGQGISEKDQARIFKKFYRVGQGNLHKVKGFGLGLSYVREVIRKHRGKIELKSKIDQGTLVKLIIPLRS